MSRPIWKGHISFGLVNVPVVLYSAERRADLSFRMIDSRNAARVRYERVNEETGEEVPWDKIVKGYEYEDGNYVLLSDEELENASRRDDAHDRDRSSSSTWRTSTCATSTSRTFSCPATRAKKGYVLLREAIAGCRQGGHCQGRDSRPAVSGRADCAGRRPGTGIAPLSPGAGRPAANSTCPATTCASTAFRRRKSSWPTKLIDGMTAKWNPSKYHDEYRDVLMKLIQRKINAGQTEAIDVETAEEEPVRQTINFMDVLKKSVEHASKARRSASKAAPRMHEASRCSRPAHGKQRAG